MQTATNAKVGTSSSDNCGLAAANIALPSAGQPAHGAPRSM
jgi:hypothetical protein